MSHLHPEGLSSGRTRWELPSPGSLQHSARGSGGSVQPEVPCWAWLKLCPQLCPSSAQPCGAAGCSPAASLRCGSAAALQPRPGPSPAEGWHPRDCKRSVEPLSPGGSDEQEAIAGRSMQTYFIHPVLLDPITTSKALGIVCMGKKMVGGSLFDDFYSGCTSGIRVQ